MEHVNSKVMRHRLPQAVVTAISVFLAGCTFPLAGGVYPPPGKSNQEQQMDMLFCKDQAKNEATTVGRQVGSVALGLTVVGVPLAVGLEKQKQREVFAQCLTARGYRVDPVTDGTTGTTASQSKTAQPPTERKESAMQGSSSSKLNLSLPADWKSQALTETMAREHNGILYAINPTTDTGVFLSAVEREKITDLRELAYEVIVGQAKNLTDPQMSEISKIEIGGREAFRFNVTGAVKGTKFTWMITLIQGSTEIAVLRTWTSAAKFEGQKEAMERLAENIRGL